MNYLLRNAERGGRRERDSVSARMLYELAKRYDEWEGEDYVGTSLRGAMKGWFHHGVATERLWPYDPDEVGELTPEAALDALKRPLGAYYRVRHRHLNHLHAAISETGILLASAAVHAGWDEVGDDGAIPYRRSTAGGHAFAIVGYDESGLWIQNSWGTDWGYGGYGHLLYEDWLEHGWDCWVARLGVPVDAFTSSGISVSSRARFEFVPRGEVDPNAIRAHTVNTGAGGRLKTHGRFGNDAAAIASIASQSIPQRTAGWSKKRVLLYAHGGLNTSKASAARIASMRDVFLDNEIYPIHFMWETGLLESIRGAVGHALSLERAQGIGERMTDLLDEAIELGARPLGRPLWNEMKRRAESNGEDGGGAAFLVGELARLRDAGTPLEIHLVGHSAGCLLHSHLVPRLVAAGFPVESLTFFAPACTHGLFEDGVMAHASAIGRVAVFNLHDEAERDDSVGPYRKSLLYLVSEAFEATRHERILGMMKFLGTSPSTSVKRFLGPELAIGSHGRGFLRGAPASLRIASGASDHGGFDEDDATLNAMLRVVLKKKPAREF